MSQTISIRQRIILTAEKYRMGIICAAFLLLLIILWNPVIHPLWNNLVYRHSDDGVPIYYFNEDRISWELHRDLEKCGLNDSKFREYYMDRSIPWGQIGNVDFKEFYDKQGKFIFAIVLNHLTNEKTAVGVQCDK